jgi:hypothetical protein
MAETIPEMQQTCLPPQLMVFSARCSVCRNGSCCFWNTGYVCVVNGLCAVAVVLGFVANCQNTRARRTSAGSCARRRLEPTHVDEEPAVTNGTIPTIVRSLWLGWLSSSHSQEPAVAGGITASPCLPWEWWETNDLTLASRSLMRPTKMQHDLWWARVIAAPCLLTSKDRDDATFSSVARWPGWSEKRCIILGLFGRMVADRSRPMRMLMR